MGSLSQLASGRREVARSNFPTITIDDLGALLQQQGLLYSSTLQTRIEQVENNFPGFISAAYKGNSAVFALEVVRFLLFSEARFQFRQMRNGQPGDLFGTKELDILEHPWLNATTGDMLSRYLLYADFAGNGYAVRRMSRTGPVIRLPRPDWITIIIGTQEPDADLADLWDIDAELVGYQYHPGGIGMRPPINLLPEQVAHFAPIPDPIARFRGMSWLTPCISEIESDSAATQHKLAYFRNGATANAVVTVNNPAIKSPDDFRTWIELFEADHVGATNAYKTLYLANGADMKVVGSDLKQMDFKVVQAAGESRLAAAAGIHPTIVGFSEGLEGSSLNSGNYTAAKRRLADGTMRPLWRNAAGSLATLITEPGGSELWYDDRDVRFLAEDLKDGAEILEINSRSIKGLGDSGYTPESVVEAVVSGDLKRLKHSGMFSVQLQPPGTVAPPPPAPNGQPARSFRARETFWTRGGELNGLIIEGTCVRLDNPWPQHFPSMFEPSEVDLPVEVRGDPEPTIRVVSPPQLTAGAGEAVRCANEDCGKLLTEAFVGSYYKATCQRCKTVTEIDNRTRAIEPEPERHLDIAPLIAVFERMAGFVLNARSTDPVQVHVPPVDMSPVAEAIRSIGLDRDERRERVDFLEEAHRTQADLMSAMASRAINVESPVTIEQGAIQVEMNAAPVTVEPSRFESGAIQVEVNTPPMSIAEGAVQVDVAPTQVTVEPSPVTIEPGAVQVEVNTPAMAIEPGAVQVEVNTPPMSIAEGAVQVAVTNPPMTMEPGAVQVDVHTPPMSIEPGAVQVAVAPAQVTIAEGAVQVASPDITIPPAAPVTIEKGAVQVDVHSPDINVAAPEITIPPAAPVTIEKGAVQVDVHSPDVNVAPPAVTVEAPHIDVQPANVTIAEGAVQVAPSQIDVHVPPAQTQVDVHVPDPKPRKVKRSKTFQTGPGGNVTGTEEIEEEI